MSAAAVLYLAHSLLRYRNFEAKGYDLGIFDQAVRQYALGKPPVVPIKGEDFHLLGDHFHPIIATLAPLYWVWDDPRMLNVAMIALLVSSALPVYLVVRTWFGHVPALLSAIALLSWWPFQAIVNWDFHEIAFGVPLISWIIWSLERGRRWLAVGLGAVLLLVREDMGITVLALALVLASLRAWWPAAAAAGLGVAGYWFAVEVVIPHFSPAGEFGYWEFTALGSSAGAAMVFLVTQPWNALIILFDDPIKVGLWALHFLPLWLLPLISRYAVLGAPVLLSRLFNDRENVWSTVYQYDAILAPIFILAALEVLHRLTRRAGSPATQRMPRRSPRWGSGSRSRVDADADVAARTWLTPSTRHTLAVALPSSVLVTAVAGSLLFPQVFPFQRTLTGQNWTMSERALAHERAVEMIPDGVCVEAADTAVPHLVQRTRVGLLGTTDVDRVSWTIIDDRVEELGGSDPLTPPEALDRAAELGFEVRSADDEGLWVLHRELPDELADQAQCGEYLRR
jgi:uncharacterized membrane protein